MKTFAMAAIAATIAAGSAVAHPGPEAHVCGIDPAEVMEYPGYAGKQGVWYDRGEYFFGFETERFLEPVAYKHWNKVEAITLHHRVNKETCELSTVEIVHPESEPEIEAPAAGGGSDNGGNEEEVTFAVISGTTPNDRMIFSYDEETHRVTWTRTSNNGDVRVVSYDGGTWWTTEVAQTVADAINDGAVWNGQNSAGDAVSIDYTTNGAQQQYFSNVWNNENLTDPERTLNGAPVSGSR